MWITTFEVRGSGAFPTDMLRYDACYPVSSEAVSALDGYGPAPEYRENGQRTVRLSHAHPLKAWAPTIGRWESFGWHVMLIERPYR